MKRQAVFQELIASSEPIFTDIYGPKKLLEERKAARNPKLRAATNTSDNVEANITNFHLEGDPSRRLLDFAKIRYFHDLPSLNGPSDLSPEGE